MSNPKPLAWARVPIVNPKSGMMTRDFLRYLQTLELKTGPTLNDNGEIETTAPVSGRTEGLGDTVGNLDSLGQAGEGFVVTRTGAPGILSQGMIEGVARNGDVVVFSTPFDTVPTVKIYPANSKVFFTGDSGSDQIARYEAIDVTKTGFTVKAAILVDTFTGVARSVVPVGVVATKDLAAEAYNDLYTFQYDVTVAVAEEPGKYSSITLGFEERASGGTFTLRDTARWVNASVSTPATFLNQLKSITIDGAVLNHEFRMTVESQFRNGGTLDSFDLLSWNESSSGVTERDATPDASHYVQWTAVEGRNE